MSIALHRESIDALDCVVLSLTTDERGEGTFPTQITTFILRNSTDEERSLEGYFTFIDMMRKRAALVWEVYCAKRELGLGGYDKNREEIVINNMKGSRFFRLFSLCVVEFREMQIRLLEERLE